MHQISEHTAVFQQITQRAIEGMFGVSTEADSNVREHNSVTTDKSIIVSIHYTGTVFGEYLIAIDESTALQIIGIDEELDASNQDEFREAICDAMSETLNTIVGESIAELQKTYAKLTITAPRVFFGEIRYPQFRTGMTKLTCSAGEIECHFCLDMMRLDLASSYKEALESLLEINAQLKEANRDLAEQQAQLVQSEKLASVGMLAAGVAHEINTPLFVVDANLSALGQYVSVVEKTVGLYKGLIDSLGGTKAVEDSDDSNDIDFVLEDTHSLVTDTRDGAERIKKIVRGLREFCDVDRAGVASTDFNVLVETAVKIMGSELDSNCELDLRLSDCPQVTCNPGEIGKVILNVLTNSCQSFDKKNQKLSIETRFDENDVFVSIQDNGCGISEDALSQVFDPFYTTRDVGDGAGLGLSISYGIIQKHSGSISVESQPGEGTQVTIRLPQSPEAVVA